MGRSAALVSPAVTVTFVRTGSPAAHWLISRVISQKRRPVSEQLAPKCPDLKPSISWWKADLSDPRYEPACICPDRWRQGRLVISSQEVQMYRQFDAPGRQPSAPFTSSHRGQRDRGTPW